MCCLLGSALGQPETYPTDLWNAHMALKCCVHGLGPLCATNYSLFAVICYRWAGLLFLGRSCGCEPMKAIQMAMFPVIMNQSRPSYSIGIIISTRLEYELNRRWWCLLAQSYVLRAIGALILFIYDFSLFSNVDHVDFMPTACLGNRIVYFILSLHNIQKRKKV
jgi:hypothetical protein